MRPIVLVCAAAAALLLVAPAAGAAVRPLDARGALGDERLSDERTITRWAVAAKHGRVYSEPRGSARRIGLLRFYTEHGSDEVYVVVRSRVVKRRTWLQVRMPMRPRSRTGWVPRSRLGPLRVVTTYLQINRRILRATLYDGGRKVWSSPVGVGARRTPTPAGRFWIRERMRGWGPYGPWAFGTSAYSRLVDWALGGVIGIHGTNQPGLIPGRPSNGCVRLPNHKIAELVRLVRVGTPVRIL